MNEPATSIYLCAPINALVEGIYEECIPFTEIKQHGDFGLGPFDHLDGEMVMLDGDIYQITADGCVQKVEETALTPFSAVTFYQPAATFDLDEPLDEEDFESWLLGLLPSPNIFYAIRIEGAFDYIKTRSVPKTECYVPLVEVAAHQPVFEFTNLEGTLGGFYTPSFMSSVSVPGLHLHLLSADREHGGHLLACRPRSVRVGIQPLYTLEMGLPTTEYYLNWDFSRDVGADLKKAEN
ncbi:MAG: acetolactate decarboxylase [Chloroflexota bacterium]